MDMYFAKRVTPLKLDELHEVGVTSIFIASKYCELEPLTLDLMVRKASHGKIKAKTIVAREMEMLQTMKFKVGAPTVYEMVENFTRVLCLKHEALRKDIEGDSSKMMDAAKQLLDISALNYRFSFEMKPSQVAISIIKLACLGQKNSFGQEIFTEELQEDLISYFLYSKGRMNGIEKRLRECFAKSE